MSKLEPKSEIPVVIFVGGYGSRIKEETIDKPKPMINVGGFPIVWHVMKIYKHFGFNKFIFTLGYKGDYIKKFVDSPSGKIFDEFDLTLVDTGEDSPTGGRLLQVADHIKTQTFMCTYGDGVSDINLDSLLDFHMSFDNVVGTTTGVYVRKFGIISYNIEGKLLNYRKGHLMDEPINAGFMVLEREYINYLDTKSQVEDPFNILAKTGQMAVYQHNGYFGAVDTYKDLETLNSLWKQSPPWRVWSDDQREESQSNK